MTTRDIIVGIIGLLIVLALGVFIYNQMFNSLAKTRVAETVTTTETVAPAPMTPATTPAVTPEAMDSLGDQNA